MTSNRASELTGLQAASGHPIGKRFLSLDVFRGLTICLMIIVNTPGKGAPFYAFLVHAKWFGFTLADLVFPSFLFAVGNAMSFSFSKSDSSNAVFLRKVLVRTLVIFLLGFLMYWFPFFKQASDGSWDFISIHQTRIMGVLQRIALCYLIASLMIRYLPNTAIAFLDALILFLYWGILYAFGSPGEELTMAGNAITKLDLWLLGENHVYKKDLIPFDPEGILSTLPAIVNVLAGYWVGRWIQVQKNRGIVLRYLLLVGALCIGAGMLWGLSFPISKKLWTSSFVLLTVGLDLVILSILMYCLELKQWRKGVAFFTILGKNPLFIYLFSELFYILLVTIKLPSGISLFAWISIEVFQRLLPGPPGVLLTAIAFMLLCWGVGWILDRRKIYIKI